MKDDLKKYLNENRAFFEDEKPSVDLWSKIDQELHPVAKKRSNFFFLKIAASALIIVSLGIMGIKQFGKDKIELSDTVSTENPDEYNNQMSGLSSDYEEVESYYSSQVSQQMNKLNKYEVDQDLIQEVEKLKNEFESLKIEMGIGADQSMVVEAMINNYRLRLMLLEDLLEAVDETEKKNTYEHDI